LDVLVVGGGIGGLAAGIALRRVGLDVLVLERTSELEVVGAGLGLAANAVQALERLGVADAVRARGRRTERLVARKPSGTTIIDLPLAGREMLGIHRADLQEVLVEALGAEALRLGAGCSGFREDGDGVTLMLDGQEVRGDLLVAADGVRSQSRAYCSETVRPATPATQGGAQ
jgi:2-polyprenyl-6-methoxyphenol hydroxylase-like FAD-dependent oxidoreductase